MRRRSLWLPLLSPWEALTRPIEVARLVRERCASHARRVVELEQELDRLREERKELAGENMQLRAERNVFGMRYRAGSA